MLQYPMPYIAKWTHILKDLPSDHEVIGSSDLLAWIQSHGYLKGKRARASLNKWLKRQKDKEMLNWSMRYVGLRAEPRYRCIDLITIGKTATERKKPKQ